MKTYEELLKELEEANKKIESMTTEMEAQTAKIESQAVEMRKLNEELDKTRQVILALEEKYNIARTRPFISKTEKLDKIVINEVEEVNKEEKKERKTNKGKKYKKKLNLDKYVIETRYVNPQESVCPECGRKLVKVSEKVRYLVETVPSTIKVIKLIKVSKKCPECNKINNKVYYPISNDDLGGSYLTPSFASYEVYHKYELGIPIEHLSKHISEQVGFEISKQTLSNHLIKVAKMLNPIYEKMKQDLISCNSQVIYADETTLSILKHSKENKGRKKSYVYVLASSMYDSQQIRIYDFHESRSIEPVGKWIKDFQGVITCDGFDGYDKLIKTYPNMKLQRCWAHVRRRYADIVKNLKEKEKAQSIAYKILSEIEKLFALEKKYKKLDYIPSEIVKHRKADMKDIIHRIKQLVFECNPIPESSLYKAIEYTKNCWDDLLTYLDNGYVELTNNLAERAVKPFVVQRKAFQASGSYAGATYTTILFSLVQTCKINDVNVIKYFEYVLENINKVTVDELLPYSDKIKAIKA